MASGSEPRIHHSAYPIDSDFFEYSRLVGELGIATSIVTPSTRFADFSACHVLAANDDDAGRISSYGLKLCSTISDVLVLCERNPTPTSHKRNPVLVRGTCRQVIVMYFYLDLNHSEFIRDDVPSEGTVEEEDKVFMLRVPV